MTPTIKLNEEVSIPVIGYGTWQLQGGEAKTAVSNALATGYRHIDTADRYGNHKEVGEAINESDIDRADIFLTTKLWGQSLMGENVGPSVDRFLEELGTDYIDLLLIHWPNKDIPIEETLNAMQECKTTGKIRAIGVSNFTKRHLEEALATGVEVTNNQIELRPRFNQKDLREYCHTKNISITAYSPFRVGDIDLPELQEIAVRYGKTPAQVILNWIVSLGLIVIPQSTDLGRMKENLDSTGFKLSEEDLMRIDSLPQEGRFNDPDFGEFDQ